MTSRHIDFWFTMGSTYSYLTVSRLADVAKSNSISFRWRPFHLNTILLEMKHIPFADKPAKATYMWRDIQRRADKYGIAIALPAPYPVKQSIVANRIAMVGMREGWGPDFVRAAYRRWFVHAQENGSEPNVSDSLREIGQEPTRILPMAESDEINRALTNETDKARELGIFGSPTFTVGNELFWGDDRLDDAIQWFHHERLSRG
jgi:2-hydroxychromene-2-carboxylate isomerase